MKTQGQCVFVSILLLINDYIALPIANSVGFANVYMKHKISHTLQKWIIIPQLSTENPKLSIVPQFSFLVTLPQDFMNCSYYHKARSKRRNRT